MQQNISAGKDTIFVHKKDPVSPFKFNEEVTSVFDDMITRSVPLYNESIKRQCQMARHFYQPGTRIYDLGCSHGNMGIMLHETFQKSPLNSKNSKHSSDSSKTPDQTPSNLPYTMIAADSSLPMIEKYKKRLQKTECHAEKEHFCTPTTPSISIINKGGQNSGIHLVCSLAEDLPISCASVVIVNLTMQFIQPDRRDQFIQGIYDGLLPGGVLLLSEKVIHGQPAISELQQEFYIKFKLENGYSELEISRKREALENILIPETIESHTKRLEKSGFQQIDTWLKWFNFTSIIAVK